MLRDTQFRIHRGAVIFVPVAYPLDFDRHSRYMPDRRDLNRCFPGRAAGSLTSRLAHTIFEQIVRRSDAGGFLTFATRPGDRVETDQVLATSCSLLGERLASGQGETCSPVDGIAIGMNTLPAARPGAPGFHIGELPDDVTLEMIRQRRTTEPKLQGQIRSDHASSINVPAVSLTPGKPSLK